MTRNLPAPEPVARVRPLHRQIRRIGTMTMAWMCALSVCASIHQHINAGAHNSEPGAKLYFVNGDRFASESGYVLGLVLATNGPASGLHRGSISFTALAATPDLGGPAFDHAAPGAHLELVVESVAGPPGGHFGFWEGNGDQEGSEVTFEVPVGTTNGTFAFRLSENSGNPDEDPYGHVHGRVFTCDVPGLYDVAFRIVDTSTLGPHGGPIHPPSDPFRMSFQAGLTIGGITLTMDGGEIEFAGAEGFLFQLEGSSQLGMLASWSEIGDPIMGDDHRHVVAIPHQGEMMYFRIRAVPQ